MLLTNVITMSVEEGHKFPYIHYRISIEKQSPDRTLSNSLRNLGYELLVHGNSRTAPHVCTTGLKPNNLLKVTSIVSLHSTVDPVQKRKKISNLF